MAETSLSSLRKQAEAAGTMTGGGGLLTEGPVLAKVVESVSTKSAKDKQQFKLKFELVGGPEAGKSVRETITISPESDKALGIAFAAIDILGGGAAVERDAEADEVAAAMLGGLATIIIYTDNGAGHDNVPRSKVKYINPAPDSVTASTTPRSAEVAF